MVREKTSPPKVPDQLKDFLAQYPKIEFIKCQFADMQGNTREVTTTSQLLSNGLTSVDGSSVFGKIIPPTESDMLLVPDFVTLYPLPWDPKTARVICNVFHPPEKEGTPIQPFAGCGRGILQKVVNRMEKLVRKNLPRTMAKVKAIKIRAYFAPEVEFLLLPKNYDWSHIHKDPNLKNNNYFLPMYRDRDLAHQEIINFLGLMGLKKEKYHTEVSSLQCEIGIGHGNVLKIADGTMTIKYIIEYVANKYGFRASFIPKFNESVNGSGMHVHQNLSITVSENGQEVKINLFFDPACPDGLSDLGRQYIAGLMKYAREITAITNPLPVSYKRLVPGAEAPTYISWDWLNRTALCRGHSRGTKKVRIEYRSPDPKCNPYLAFAAMLAAGLSGIEEELSLQPNDDRNFYEDHSGVEELPGNLGEALTEMKKSKMLRYWLGKFVIDNLYKLGIDLWKEESRQVTDVDIERHL